MARLAGSIGKLRQEFEIFHVGEDAIVRHERHLEPDGGRRHPAVRFMVFLAQAVSGLDTPCAERGISLGKTWSRPDDLARAISYSSRRSRSGPHPARAGGACAGHSWNLVIIPGGIWCGTARIGET